MLRGTGFFVKKLKIQQITLRLAVSFSLVMRRWSDNLKNKVQLMTQTEPVSFTLSLIHKEDLPYGIQNENHKRWLYNYIG